MSRTRNVAVAVVILGVVYYIATQRAKFTVELTSVVRAKPEACVEFFKREAEKFEMKFHPFMKRVEVLKSEVTDSHEYKDRNLYETLPLLPFWEHDVIIHAVSVLDFEKKEVTIKADNYKAEHDFIGFKINIAWKFLPHPEHPEWTLVQDTINNDFSYGIKFLLANVQRRGHEEILQAFKTGVEQLK